MGLNIEVLRELTEEDLTALPAKLARGASSLDKVRAIHHAQARLLAQGQKPGVVASALGVSHQTIHSLLDDPTFQELITYYRDQLDVVYLTTHEEAALLARMAMGELRDRLEVNPGKFSDNQLRELAIAMLDRTDLPPKTGTGQAQAVPTITFNFGGNVALGPTAPQLDGHPEGPTQDRTAMLTPALVGAEHD